MKFRKVAWGRHGFRPRVGVVNPQQLPSLLSNSPVGGEEFWNRDAERRFALQFIRTAKQLIDPSFHSAEQTATFERKCLLCMSNHGLQDGTLNDHLNPLHQVDRIDIDRDPGQLLLVVGHILEARLQDSMKFQAIGGPHQDVHPELAFQTLDGCRRRP